MFHTGYDPALVALSIAIAVFASYTAPDLGGRVRGAAAGMRRAWVGRRGALTRNMLVSGPLMGIGVGRMHFTGMAAVPLTAVEAGTHAAHATGIGIGIGIGIGLRDGTFPTCYLRIRPLLG